MSTEENIKTDEERKQKILENFLIKFMKSLFDCWKVHPFYPGTNYFFESEEEKTIVFDFLAKKGEPQPQTTIWGSYFIYFPNSNNPYSSFKKKL